MGVDEKFIGEIVKRILSIAKPDRVVLFGSAATGQANADSDYPDTAENDAVEAHTLARMARDAVLGQVI